jgi:hypothetical protein
MNMRPVPGSLIVGWFLLGTCCAAAHGDGGSVLASKKAGGYHITVFAAPTPLRAGPVDISVLVQDARTGEPLPDARVTVHMTSPGQAALEYPATAEAATNKLLRAALFELPEPGHWELQVQVEGGQGVACIGCSLDVAEALPRWLQLWQWIAWPAPVIALFGLHQVLTRRKARYGRGAARASGAG